MPHRLESARSDSVSAGCDRPSGGRDISCGVDIPIMDVAATGAGPLPDAQRRVEQVSAPRARLAGGIPPVDHDHDRGAAVPLASVLRHGAEVRPGRIADGPDHVAYRQVLDHDRVVLTNESSGQLVRQVPPSVGDPGMDAGDLGAGLGPVVRAARQVPLRTGKEHPFPVSGVGDLLPGGDSRQGRQPGVDTDLGRHRWERFDGGVDQDRHVPPPGRVTRHRHRGGLGTVGEWTRPDDVQGPVHLGQDQRAVAPPERRPGVLGRCPRLLAGLELRVLGAFVEEVGERLLQVSQALPQRDRGHLVEESELVGLLPRGGQCRGVGVVDPPPFLVPGGGAGVQRPVADRPDAAEGPRRLHRLDLGGVEAKPVDPLHHRRRHTPQGLVGEDRSCLSTSDPAVPITFHGSTPPRSEGRGISRLELR
jgi:hypothetical protein